MYITFYLITSFFVKLVAATFTGWHEPFPLASLHIVPSKPIGQHCLFVIEKSSTHFRGNCASQEVSESKK